MVESESVRSPKDDFSPSKAVDSWQALAIGGFCILMGVGALIGWNTDSTVLIQVRPGFSALQPVTALCFLLAGLAVIIRSRKPGIAKAFSIAVLALACITAFEYFADIELPLHQLLVPWGAAGGAAPGRMAPNTMALWLVAGIALVADNLRAKQPVIGALAGAIILSTGAVSLLGYVIDVPTYGWWQTRHMGIGTAAGFAALGALLLWQAWTSTPPGESRTPPWAPAVIGLAALTGTALLWQALAAEEQRRMDVLRQEAEALGASGAALRELSSTATGYLPQFALGLGLALSVLAIVASQFAVTARRRAHAAESARKALEQEIEERRRAERQLNRSEEQRLLAMDAAGMGSWSWEPELNRLEIGDRARRLFRLPASGAIDRKTFLSPIHPEDRAEAERAMLDTPDVNQPISVEFRVITAGATRWLSARGQWRPGNGGAYGVLIEITQRKLAEQALRRSHAELEGIVARRTAEIRSLNATLKRHNTELLDLNRELEAFTYSVSHDLRAPLRHIDGFSQILLDESADLSDDARRAIDRIRYGARQMGRMVDDLLELSRMGRRELVRKPANLKSLVDETITLLKTETENRPVELRIGELPTIAGDPGLLKHVLMNLISNALKFTRDRNPAIIEIGHYMEGESPVIYVRDNGVGFDMRHSGKLFGIFQRLHRRDEFEGTGVGLATVQRIVHKHGGRVWAEAKPGEGATFYFTTDSGPKTEPNHEQEG